MNIELLKRVKAHILAEPLRIFMGDWMFTGEEIEGNELIEPECKTVACISGWATKLTDNPNPEAGAIPLELTLTEAENLFYTSDWPDYYRKKIYQCKFQTTEYAQVVAERIDHFIKTGE